MTFLYCVCACVCVCVWVCLDVCEGVSVCVKGVSTWTVTNAHLRWLFIFFSEFQKSILKRFQTILKTSQEPATGCLSNVKKRRKDWRYFGAGCTNNTNTHTHTPTRTYTRTHIHTYIQTYIHTYIHTYLHNYIHAYKHTDIHTYISTYIHTNIQTYILT